MGVVALLIAMLAWGAVPAAANPNGSTAETSADAAPKAAQASTQKQGTAGVGKSGAGAGGKDAAGKGSAGNAGAGNAAAGKAGAGAGGAAAAAGDDFESERLDPGMFATDAEAEAARTKEEPGSAGAVIRMFAGLLLVLAIIYGVNYLLRSYNKSRFPGLPGAGANGGLQVIASTPLAANRMLHLVRVGEEIVLVGATDASISRLGAYDVENMANTGGDGAPVDSEFQRMLQGAMAETPHPTGAPGQQDTFMRRLVANLQLMTSR